MTKMKTHSGAKKRFRVTGTGRVKRRKANRNHILEKKSASRKRRLAETPDVAPGNLPRIRRQLGI